MFSSPSLQSEEGIAGAIAVVPGGLWSSELRARVARDEESM